MKSFRHTAILLFLRICALLLFATSVAKLVAVMTGGRHLDVPDPFLSFVTERWVLLAGAALEAMVVTRIVSDITILRKLRWVLWLCVLFSVFRMGRWLSPQRAPCSCLGYVGDFVGITKETADHVALGLLVFMTIGAAVLARYAAASHVGCDSQGAPVAKVGKGH